MTTDRYDDASLIETSEADADLTARRRPWSAMLLGALMTLHGATHMIGFVADLEVFDLALPAGALSPLFAGWWLAAGLLWVGAALTLAAAPRWWWAVALVAVTVSQAVVVTAWSLAWAGTVVNVVLLAAALRGAAARGPSSLRAEYERALTGAWPAQHETLLMEADLVDLPEPVQRHLRRVGVVGRPPVRDFRATWTGRMRSTPESAWMPFTADQLDVVSERRRYFKMDATMKGLPVDVLHVFDGRGATMRVRLFSVRSKVDASGPALTRAETVTLFNDLCLYAPSVLTEPAVTWGPSDSRWATAHLTVGPNTITATLFFDDNRDLTDFVSDDRVAARPDGTPGPAVRWSTPIRSYARSGSARVPSRADVPWHPDSGAWTYGQFALTSLSHNTSTAERLGKYRPASHMVPPTSPGLLRPATTRPGGLSGSAYPSGPVHPTVR
jgi:hypothetical protein